MSQQSLGSIFISSILHHFSRPFDKSKRQTSQSFYRSNTVAAAFEATPDLCNLLLSSMPELQQPAAEQAKAHLTIHEQLADVLHTFVEGLDDNNAAQIASTLVPDAVLDVTSLHEAGLVPFANVHGRDEVVKAVLDDVGHLDTTHMVTNIRTRVRTSDSGEMVANLTAYALAQHWKPGEGADPANGRDLLAVNKYTAELVQDESPAWRLRLLRIESRWAKGDATHVFSN